MSGIPGGIYPPGQGVGGQTVGINFPLNPTYPAPNYSPYQGSPTGGSYNYGAVANPGGSYNYGAVPTPGDPQADYMSYIQAIMAQRQQGGNGMPTSGGPPGGVTSGTPTVGQGMPLAQNGVYSPGGASGGTNSPPSGPLSKVPGSPLSGGPQDLASILAGLGLGGGGGTGPSPSMAGGAGGAPPFPSGVGMGPGGGFPNTAGTYPAMGGGGGGGGGGGAAADPAASGNPNEFIRYPNAVDFNGRTVYTDDLGHGDFGEGYDSLGHGNLGTMGTGVPDRVLKQQFETMQRMGQTDWPGSFQNWKKNGMPRAGQYTPEQMAELVGGYKSPRDFNFGQQPGGGGAGPINRDQPPAGGPPPNWMVPGMGNGPWNVSGPGGPMVPPSPPATGGGALPGPGGTPPAPINRDQAPNTPPPANNGMNPIPGRDQMMSAMMSAYGMDPAMLQNQQYMQSMQAQEQAQPGSTMLSQTPLGEFIGGGPAGGGMVSAYQGNNGFGGGWNPGNAMAGIGYQPPAFAQPSYDQSTFPNLSEEEFNRLLAFNNNMALPWSEFIRGSAQNDRDYTEDVRRFNTNLGEDTRRYDTNFGEDQYRDRRNYDTDVMRDSRDYGENVRRYDQGFGEDTRRYNQGFGEGQRQFDTTFGEGQRQFNTTFGEGQRQYDTTFGEGKRQFDESLDWQKTADAMRAFGARQMPNVRQVSFR